MLSPLFYSVGAAGDRDGEGVGRGDFWDYGTEQVPQAPNDTAYKRWSCHSGLKLLCKLC